MESNKLHLNIPQLLAYTVWAQEMYLRWGRGTGKSEGAIAPQLDRNIRTMPRGQHGLIGATYVQILTRTLPATLRGLERLNYREDYHFVVGKKPPKHFDSPIYKIKDPNKAIFFWNGATIPLISQDIVGSSNGLSLDSLIGDEAKFLDNEKMQEETFPTMRGNKAIFGHLHNHRSKLFCSDAPDNPKGRWFIDAEKQMDRKVIAAILLAQKALLQCRNERERIKLQKYLYELRKGSIFYSNATTIDNVEALGLDVIRDLRRSLDTTVFNTSVLNMVRKKVGSNFYPGFDEERNCYSAQNIAYIESLELRRDLKQDCRWDSDIRTDEPLRVALDYGGRINCVVVGQTDNSTNLIKVLNGMHVLHPQKLSELAEAFDAYYTPHKKYNPDIVYYYDHTAVGKDGEREPYYKIWIDSLEALGWNVTPVYIGQTPAFKDRYEVVNNIFKNAHPEGWKCLVNADNCDKLVISLNNAPLKDDDRGFRKNKASERPDSGIPPEEATDYSDALDTLFIGVVRHPIYM